MNWMYYLIAFFGGACASIQIGVNNSLRSALGDPVVAALISFAVGTVALMAYVFAMGIPMSLGQAAASGPFWMWFGGLLGAVFVATSILVAGNIGAGAAMVWIIAAQLVTSLLLDHFGLFGFTIRLMSPVRLFGAGLLIVGAYLVSRY